MQYAAVLDQDADVVREYRIAKTENASVANLRLLDALPLRLAVIDERAARVAAVDRDWIDDVEPHAAVNFEHDAEAIVSLWPAPHVRERLTD